MERNSKVSQLRNYFFFALFVAFSLTNGALPDDLKFNVVFDTDGDVHLDRPLWVGENPGLEGTFLVCEQYSGKVWLLEEADGKWKKSEFHTASVKAYRHEEEGLLGFAFHPDYKQNGKYYLYYTAPEDIDGWYCWTILEQRTAAADFRKDSGNNHEVLMRYKQRREAHNGAPLEFGPDGYLYIGLGDGGNKQYTLENNDEAQKTLTPLGSILRIDVDNAEGGKPYAVPADNPWVGDDNYLPEMFAYGFRNPWRFSFDPLSGDLWAADVGNNLREEIAIVRKGENHGWRVMEGNLCFDKYNPVRPKENCDKTGITLPVVDLNRSQSVSITGGYVFRGRQSSPFYGAYICADYGLNYIYAIKQKDRQMTEMKSYRSGFMFNKITSFGIDTKGNIYMTGWNSRAYSKSDKRGYIYKLDLGEPDVTSVVTGTHGGERIFSGLNVQRKNRNILNLSTTWAGDHRFELRNLRGNIIASSGKEGAGTISIELSGVEKGIHVLIWKYNDLTFSHRIYLR